jgi:hypothetical protein
MNQGNSMSNGTIIMYRDIPILPKNSNQFENPCLLQDKKAFEVAQNHLSKNGLSFNENNLLVLYQLDYEKQDNQY